MTDLARVTAAEVSTDPRDQFDMAVDAFVMSKRSKETQRAYRQDLQQWRKWCDRRGVSPWRAQRVTVDSWARAMEDVAGVAPSTVARRISAVASFYRYLSRLPESPALVALGWTWVSPAADVERPRFGGEGKTMSLTADELDRILHVARWAPDDCTCRPFGHYHGRREVMTVILLGTLAIRARELVTATREDYTTDHGRKVVTVTRKGGKRKKLVLEPPVAEQLDNFLAERPGRLLIGTGNAAADYQWVYRLCQRLGFEAGISSMRSDATIERRLTPHVFRATFATLYLDQPGANLAWLQDFMGHASPDTTRLYDRGANALNRLADVAHTVVRQLHLETD